MTDPVLWTASEASPGVDRYRYSKPGPTHAHSYLLPPFLRVVDKYVKQAGDVFEIGAGNGHVAVELVKLGYKVAGIEPSIDGVKISNSSSAFAKIVRKSIYDDLGSYYGSFDFVFALEVIEHLYAPRELVKQAYKPLRPGGTMCLSTPFHGYLKNLSLAISGRLDAHFTALWDHGHIKFWSLRTLTALVEEGGVTLRGAVCGQVLSGSKVLNAYRTEGARRSTVS